jgi:hypothetical protein
MSKKHISDKIIGAMADKKAAQTELFQRLRSLPVHQLAQELPAAVGRLTQAQLSAILGVKSYPVTASSSDLEESSNGGLISDFLINLRQISPSLLAMSAAAVVIVASSLVSSGAHWLGGSRESVVLERPVHAEFWPPCPRLSAQVDGCLYRVQFGISLADAAEALALPLTQLRTANSQIPQNQTVLTSGSRLVVWRGLGSLHQ